MAYKKLKKSTVQLTSLLDLLFVMIFVSLIQQKTVTKSPSPEVVATPAPTVAPIATQAPTPAPVATPSLYHVGAKFNFYGTPSNPSLPQGTYLMQGTFDLKTGKLQLGGVSWIQRPENYDMVPLSGEINPNLGTFVGQIEFLGCERFTLERKEKGNGSPISGQWSGSYNCTQGETGLTLTID